MATSSAMKHLQPRFQPVFGHLTSSDDAEIRIILSKIDELLIEFAQYLGANQVGLEGTGLDLIWYPSGQIEISSFVGVGYGSRRVQFIVSLRPRWFFGNFPTEPTWEIEAEIHADCQHAINHESQIVHELPTVRKSQPIDSVIALRNRTIELVQLGKDKPIEYWLQLAGDTSARGKPPNKACTRLVGVCAFLGSLRGL